MVQPKDLISKRDYSVPSPSLVNFDYTDVASRQGYVLFDGYTDSSGSAHLSGDAMISKDVSLQSGALSGTNTEELASFQTSNFNYPAIIQGDVFITAPFNVDPTGAGSGSAQGAILLQFYHNTTLLFSAESHTITKALASNEPENAVVIGTVTNESIKIGDTLKVVLTAEGKSGGYAAQITVGTDPTDSGDTTIDKSADTCSTARFVVGVPFKIDI